MKRVVVVGGGFAGLAAARALGREPELEVALVDRRNHHLFQPLLYQVATAGLSPADIAVPIRSLLSRSANSSVLRSEARRVELSARTLHTDAGPREFRAFHIKPKGAGYELTKENLITSTDTWFGVTGVHTDVTAVVSPPQ